MTREQHLFKVMSAVRDCLQSCAQSESPAKTLHHFVARLEHDPQWETADVREVERTAQLALAGRKARQDNRSKGSKEKMHGHQVLPRKEEQLPSRTDRHWS
jgi:hypothetical protein